MGFNPRSTGVFSSKITTFFKVLKKGLKHWKIKKNKTTFTLTTLKVVRVKVPLVFSFIFIFFLKKLFDFFSSKKTCKSYRE